MKNTSENNSNNDIKTKLSDITVRLLEESKEVANLQDYKGELFDLKTYSVVLTDGNYLINGQIEEGVTAIYIFYSSNGLRYVDLTFNAIQYAAKTNANFKDEENKKHFVYLGKSLDVKSRIEEHLESEDKSPYSLKYNHKDRNNQIGETTLFIFCLKQDFHKYKELILSTIETYLHQSCKPIIGSRRV